MTRLRLLTSGTFRSLRHRNFRLFFAGQLISQVGTWLTLVAASLLVLERTDNGLLIGALAAAHFGPVLVLGPLAGLVADRHDKRRVMLAAQVVAMGKSFAFAALAFWPEAPLAGFYAVALVGGVAVSFDNPARRAFVVEMVPLEDVNNSVSLNSAVMTSSRIFGPALAGLLATTVGYGWCFTIDGLSYIAVLAALLRMDVAQLHPSPPAAKAKGQIREGLRYARHTPELWVPLVMMTVIGTLAFNFQVVLPLFVTRSLGSTPGMFTVLYSVISLGSFLGALAGARRTNVAVSTVALAAMAFGVSMALLAAAPNLATAFPAGLVLGVCSIAFMTSSTALVQVRSDPAMRGRVLALQAMVFLGSTPLGGPLVGAVCEALGARAGFAVGALACLGAGAWGLVVSRRLSPQPALQPV